MDVEVILHNGELKVLEIDARLPSQTPTAVYRSTGINMLELLARFFVGVDGPGFPGSGENPGTGKLQLPAKGVIYEHIRVTPGNLEFCGEHIMAEGGPLRLITGFFGADEAITDYSPGRNQWVATLIITAGDLAGAWEKRNQVIHDLRSRF
jgi:pyrrolysine biosynthesis protein PylC